MKKEIVHKYINQRISKMLSEDKSIDDVIDALSDTVSKYNLYLLDGSINPSKLKYIIYHNEICLDTIDDLYKLKEISKIYKNFDKLKLANVFKLRNKILGKM